MNQVDWHRKSFNEEGRLTQKVDWWRKFINKESLLTNKVNWWRKSNDNKVGRQMNLGFCNRQTYVQTTKKVAIATEILLWMIEQNLAWCRPVYELTVRTVMEEKFRVCVYIISGQCQSQVYKSVTAVLYKLPAVTDTKIFEQLIKIFRKTHSCVSYVYANIEAEAVVTEQKEWWSNMQNFDIFLPSSEMFEIGRCQLFIWV